MIRHPGAEVSILVGSYANNACPLTRMSPHFSLLIEKIDAVQRKRSSFKREAHQRRILQYFMQPLARFRHLNLDNVGDVRNQYDVHVDFLKQPLVKLMKASWIMVE